MPGGGGVEGSGGGTEQRAHQRGAHGGAEDRHCGCVVIVETGGVGEWWCVEGFEAWGRFTRFGESRGKEHKTAEDVPACSVANQRAEDYGSRSIILSVAGGGGGAPQRVVVVVRGCNTRLEPGCVAPRTFFRFLSQHQNFR